MQDTSVKISSNRLKKEAIVAELLQKVEKAKGIIVRAVLGLLVILIAYGFTQFIFTAITQP